MKRVKVERKPRNKFEQSIVDQLIKAKVDYEYEPRSKILPYTIEAKYEPDVFCSGSLFLECKGYLRPEHRRKLAAVKRCHPDVDLRIIFQKARPEYIRWAEKLGFPWAEKTIPEKWFKEKKK